MASVGSTEKEKYRALPLVRPTLVWRNRYLVYIFLASTILFDEKTIRFASNRDNPLFDAYFGFRGIDLMAMLLMAVFALSGGVKTSVLKRNPLVRPLAFMLVPVFLGILRGVYFQNSQMFADWKNYVVGYGFFIVLITCFGSVERIERLYKTLLVLTLLRTVYTMWEYSTGGGNFLPRFNFQAPFVYNTPILFALILCSSFGVANFLVKDKAAWAHRHRWKLLILAVFFTLLIFLSFKRSIWLVTIVTMVGVPALLRSFIVKRALYAVLASALLFSSAYAIFNLESFAPQQAHFGLSLRSMNPFGAETGTIHDDSNRSHLDNVAVAWKLLNEQGLLLGGGVGLIEDHRLVNPSIHNGLLYVWYKFGLLGACVYLFCFGKLFYKYLRSYGQLSPREKAITVGAFSTVLAWFAVSLVFVPPFFTSITGAILMFLMFGILSNTLVINEDRRRRKAFSSHQLAMTSNSR